MSGSRAPIGKRLARRLGLRGDDGGTAASARRFLDTSPDGGLQVYHVLPADPVVFEVGGYLGDWTEEMRLNYPGRYHVFEPVRGFAAQTAERFADAPDVTVHAFGLGGSNHNAEIRLQGDGSSAVGAAGARGGADAGAVETVRIRDTVEVMDELGVDRLDLLSLNAEGAEYEILERLIAADAIDRIGSALIQFHDVLPDARLRRDAIQAAFARTHRKLFDFPFCWEKWIRRRPGDPANT